MMMAMVIYCAEIEGKRLREIDGKYKWKGGGGERRNRAMLVPAVFAVVMTILSQFEQLSSLNTCFTRFKFVSQAGL